MLGLGRWQGRGCEKAVSDNGFFEFKYSVPKLLIRIFAGAILIILFCHLLENPPNGFAEACAWIIALLGSVLLLPNTLKLMNIRFLRLTESELQYSNIWSYFLWFIIRIPARHLLIPSVTSVKWHQIEDVRIKRNLLFRKEIKITYSVIGRKRPRKHGISISCSEYNAEHILKAINERMSTDR